MSDSGGKLVAKSIREFLEDHKALRNLSSSEIRQPNLELKEETSSQDESDAVSRVADYGLEARARSSKKSAPPHYSGDSMYLENLGKGLETPKPQDGLKMAIELAMSSSLPNDTQTFLPLGQIEAICQKEIVRRQISYTFGETSPDIDRYTDYVCDNQYENSSRKIFAILVLIDQLHSLSDFVEAEIKDRHLPFRKQGGEPFTLIKRATLKKENSQTVSCFDNWNPVEKRKFYENQWRLLSPFFGRASDNTVALYELDEQSIMPWIKKGEEKRGTYIPSEVFGGFAKVTQFEIHPDHHAFESKKFAIKQLLEDNDIPFNKEFKNLKRVETRDHLLPVYAAYRQGKYYSFIFPWADGGSLHDLWMREPRFLKQRVFVDIHEDTSAHRTRKVITWLAGQLAGLTGKYGLGFLHDTQFLEPVQPTLVVPEEKEQLYGIHGDIKPHNILYFEQDKNGGQCGLGLFKISDFGLTGFHSALTRSRQPPTGPHSPTYRAPEYGMSATYLSRKYDIWSLGCVLLQFLTWLISGPDDLNNFDLDRLNENDGIKPKFTEDPGTKPIFTEDTFFVLIPNGGSRDKISVVNHIAKLQATVTQGNYLYDCLELIGDKMLKINIEERADCREVHEALAGYYARCRQDPEYATATLPSFDEPTRSTPPTVPAIVITNDSPNADSKVSNGIRADQVSDMSAALAATGVGIENNVPHIEQNRFTGSKRSRSDRDASTASADNDPPDTEHVTKRRRL